MKIYLNQTKKDYLKYVIHLNSILEFKNVGNVVSSTEYKNKADCIRITENCVFYTVTDNMGNRLLKTGRVFKNRASQKYNEYEGHLYTLQDLDIILIELKKIQKKNSNKSIWMLYCKQF